jgi:hypothetical protein
MGSWVGPRACLDDVEKRKFITLPGPVYRSGSRQSLYRLRYPGSRYSYIYIPPPRPRQSHGNCSDLSWNTRFNFSRLYLKCYYVMWRNKSFFSYLSSSPQILNKCIPSSKPFAEWFYNLFIFSYFEYFLCWLRFVFWNHLNFYMLFCTNSSRDISAAVEIRLPAGARDFFSPIVFTKQFCQTGWSSTNALQFYSVSARFESPLGHRLYWLWFFVDFLGSVR